MNTAQVMRDATTVRKGGMASVVFAGSIGTMREGLASSSRSKKSSSTAEAVRAWGQHAEHLLAQALGRDRWYESYTLRVAVVERAHSFTRTPTESIP